jgi:two-component system, cell cycle sensor histidine kinase and response regulator CckA
MTKKNKILLVEDEDLLRELLADLLKEHGLDIITAADGVEAVEIFTEHQDEIGVVLSDLGLPRLGGWDAFLKMREINPNLIGILASGYFDPIVKDAIIKSGAKNFIQKPYDPPEIVATIQKLLTEQV